MSTSKQFEPPWNVQGRSGKSELLDRMVRIAKDRGLESELAAAVRPAGPGVLIDPHVPADTIREAMAALESVVDLPDIAKRFEQARYLHRVAYELMRDSPQVHVRFERLGGPTPYVVVAVTRQLYPEGDLTNDEPPVDALFEAPV